MALKNRGVKQATKEDGSAEALASAAQEGAPAAQEGAPSGRKRGRPKGSMTTQERLRKWPRPAWQGDVKSVHDALLSKAEKSTSKMGRPLEYKPDYVKEAAALALLGLVDTDIAKHFGVEVETIYYWINRYPDFSNALKSSRALADSNVVTSLYKRATGYQIRAVKVYADPETGEQKTFEYLEDVPPETTACIFWLKNRRPDLWRDKHQLAIAGTVTVAREALTDEQLLAIAASGGEGITIEAEGTDRAD